MGSRALVLCGVALLCLAPAPAAAEIYVAGQGGLTMPNRLYGLTGVATPSNSNAGSTLSNVPLQRGLLYGGKLGYYSSDVPWLGAELEVYQSQLKVKAEGYNISGPGGSSSGTLANSTFRMTTYAVNLLARYPGESFQPYAGMGIGLFTPSVSNTTSAGLNVLGGLRYKFSRHFGVFMEGKYNYAPSVDFPDPSNSARLFNGSYSAVNFALGLAVIF